MFQIFNRNTEIRIVYFKQTMILITIIIGITIINILWIYYWKRTVN